MIRWFRGRTITCSLEEPFEITLKKFVKMIDKSRVLKEYKMRKVYVKPSQKKREKRFRAIKREQKRVRGIL